jgi:hypothetical protein
MAQTVPKKGAEPKAHTCYRLLVRELPPQAGTSEPMWLRFVDDRSGPVTGEGRSAAEQGVAVDRG